MHSLVRLAMARMDYAKVATNHIARHWIDGEWIDSGPHHDSFDPATGERIGTYALAGAEEAKMAVSAAVRAFRVTDWKINRELRARVLLEMADRFEARTKDPLPSVEFDSRRGSLM